MADAPGVRLQVSPRGVPVFHIGDSPRRGPADAEVPLLSDQDAPRGAHGNQGKGQGRSLYPPHLPVPQRRPVSPRGQSPRSPMSPGLTSCVTAEDVSQSKRPGPEFPRLSVGTHRWLRPARPISDYEDHETHDDSDGAPNRFWSVVVIAALIAATLSFLVDEGIVMAGLVRTKLSNGGWLSLMFMVVANTSICVAARLLVRTTIEAEGSGIPEIKTMLFSTAAASKPALKAYLTMKVLTVKAIALMMVVGAGLPIGKEGPFVHIAACITANLDPGFQKSKGAVSHLLLCAVAVGVGTVFSAPLGGVIFALEVMLPQVYDITAYLGCFVASVVSAVMYSALKTYTAGEAVELQPLMSTDVLPREGGECLYPLLRLSLDVILGAICGVAGGLFVRFHSLTSRSLKAWRMPAAAPVAQSSHPAPAPGGAGPALPIRAPKRTTKHDSVLIPQHNWAAEEIPVGDRRGSRHGNGGPVWQPKQKCFSGFGSLLTCLEQTWWRDLFTVGAVAALNTIMVEQLPIIGGRTQPQILSELFSKELLFASNWELSFAGPFNTLVLCFLAKWITTVLALSLPTPTGIVAPTMIIGALIGHTYVALLPEGFKNFLMDTGTGIAFTDGEKGAFAARFAIVGAAAFSAAVSSTFSVAITVFEVIALPNTLLGLSSATLVAVFVGKEISVGFFDQILLNKGLKGVPRISDSEFSRRPASTAMRRLDLHSDCLSHRASLSDMQRLLNKSPEQQFFPVVHYLRGGTEALLVGEMSRAAIQQVLDVRGAWERDLVIDFLEPSQWLQEAQSSTPLLNRMPAHVPPYTQVKDLFLLLKVKQDEQVVYVTSKGRLLGIVTREELLGKDPT